MLYNNVILVMLTASVYSLGRHNGTVYPRSVATISSPMYTFTTFGFRKSTFPLPWNNTPRASVYIVSMKDGHIPLYTINQNRLYLRQ